MKLLNLALVLGLLCSVTAIAEVGVMDKSEIRDGQLICPKILAKQEADRKAAAAQATGTSQASAL